MPTHEPTYASNWQRYFDAGYSPLPIPIGKKHPPPDRTTGRHPVVSRAQCEHWAQHRPDDNIALRLPDGIIGIDVDNYGEKTGAETMATLAETLGPIGDTWSATSRTDGVSGIRLYRIPVGLTLRSVLGPSVEIIRHRHRYMMAPPSIHPNGGQYRWTSPEGEHADHDRTPEYDELTIMGDGYVDEVTKPTPLDTTEHDTGLETGVSGPPSAPVRHALETWTHRHPSAGRHDTMIATTMALARLDLQSHPGAHDAIQWLRAEFITAVGNDRTDVDDEYTKAVMGAYTEARQTPALSPPYADLDLVNRLDVAVEKGRQNTAAKNNGHAIGDLGVNTADTPNNATTYDDQISPYEIVWHEFAATDHRADDFICAPILARGRAHALYATAKVGKSLLTLEMAVCLATGRPFLDWPGGEPMTVLYFDFEMTQADLYERLESFNALDPDTLDRLRYVQLAQIPPIDTAAGGLAVVEGAANRDADLVIIDTTARSVGGDENASETMNDANRHTFGPLKRMGITTLRVDHAGKDPERGQRGSSAKNDIDDIIWQLVDHGGEQMKLTATHARVGWIEKEIGLERSFDVAGTVHRRTAIVYPPGIVDAAMAFDVVGVPVDHARKPTRADYPELAFQNQQFGMIQKYRRETRVRDMQQSNESKYTEGRSVESRTAPRSEKLRTDTDRTPKPAVALAKVHGPLVSDDSDGVYGPDPTTKGGTGTRTDADQTDQTDHESGLF